jgi:hypothetical protein
MKESTAASKAVWQTTPVPNLGRYIPSGILFARVRVKGKLIRRSLKTKTLTVGKLRLGDFEKKERPNAEHNAAFVGGKWQLVCSAYNLKRLHSVGAGLKLAGQG